MPNVLISTVCNRSCPYCFAKKHTQAQGDSLVHMPLENVAAVADFLLHSKVRSFAMLGGEPTLHPQFITIYQYVLRRGFKAKIFTNACASPEFVKDLQRVLIPDRTLFLVNLNHPSQRSEVEMDRQHSFFSAFAGNCGLSFNIYQPDMDLDFLIHTIDRYKLRRKIRLGLAHPIVGEANLCLAPAAFPDVMRRVVEFIARCDQSDISTSLDCGFTLCNFSDEQLGIMARAQTSMKFVCGPIIDIGPDLRTWACLPLSNVAPKPLAEFCDMSAAIVYFREVVSRETERRGFSGIYPQCQQCRYRRRGYCIGGCRAHAFAGAGE